MKSLICLRPVEPMAANYSHLVVQAALDVKGMISPAVSTVRIVCGVDETMIKTAIKIAEILNVKGMYIDTMFNFHEAEEDYICKVYNFFECNLARADVLVCVTSERIIDVAEFFIQYHLGISDLPPHLSSGEGWVAMEKVGVQRIMPNLRVIAQPSNFVH